MPRYVRPLTESRIRTAKPDQYPLWDGGGLHLIPRSGTRMWRFKYSRPDGRENRLALGAYPAVSLAQARELREQARAQLRAGRDPAAEREAVKEKARRTLAGNVKATAESWLAYKAPGWSKESARKARYVMDTYLLPDLGNMSVATVTSKDIKGPLVKLAKHAPDLARKARQYVAGMIRYAQREGLRDEDRGLPLDEILPSYEKGHIPAATSPADAAAVLKAIAAYESPVTRAALLMCAFTALRPGVVVAMRWDEIQGEEWHIPPAKMKMRFAHVVPMPKQALALLEQMRTYSGKREHVFPPLARQKTPHLHRDALSSAMRDMGFQGKHAPHGFRGMLRTVARERLGISADILESQLAHAKKGDVQKAYDRTTFDDARRDAMQKWADYLDKLRSGRNVTPIRSAA